MKNLVVTEEIWKEGNMYTAYCPELDIASCELWKKQQC